MLQPRGWALAPAYDMNPDPHSVGLKLNISETDNAQDIDLALSVASAFRVKHKHAQEIVSQVIHAANQWRSIATSHGLSPVAQDRMHRAFRVAEARAGG
jgi:serine/threonine-protein kinase HipA